MDELIADLSATLKTELTSIWLPIQLGQIALGFMLAAGLTVLLHRKYDIASATARWPDNLRRVAIAFARNDIFLFYAVIAEVLSAILVATVPQAPIYLVDISTDLAAVWLLIAIVSSMIRNPFVNRLVAIAAWSIAALSILNLLDATAAKLDSVGIMMGGIRVTPLLVLKTTVLLLLTLWLANAIGNFFDRRLQGVQDLTPSVKELLAKLIRVALMTFAVMFVMASVGIDVAVLAVFTGAVGVGIGFGLQKIISNLVSGIILLADKSIKPGDVISVGDHFGWVVNMGARYSAIDLKDGRELLVPNEDLITQKVINWSYSATAMQLQIKFNATYDSDPRKTQAAAVAAALTVPQVLKEPTPSCHVTGFGTTAIEYVLWCWIKEAAAGPTRVRSAVMLAIWDAFAREGVKLPVPGPQHVVLERTPPQNA